MHDASNFRQSMAIPIGQSCPDDPLGNDCCRKACGPSSVQSHLGDENRMETHIEESHQLKAGVGYEVGESQPAGAACAVTPKGKYIPARSSDSAVISQNGEAGGLDQGQKAEGILSHSNGPLEEISNKSRDTNVNLFGPNFNLDPSRPTTPEIPQKDQQKQLVSAMQVYSRKKGCTKKWAQVSGKHPDAMDCAEGRMVETDGKEPETQLKLGSALQVGEEDTTALFAEAKNQWEMANQLGLSCGIDQTKFIDKIAEMEIRDRMEAETLGNRINHHEHPVL